MGRQQRPSRLVRSGLVRSVLGHRQTDGEAREPRTHLLESMTELGLGLPTRLRATLSNSRGARPCCCAAAAARAVAWRVPWPLEERPEALRFVLFFFFFFFFDVVDALSWTCRATERLEVDGPASHQSGGPETDTHERRFSPRLGGSWRPGFAPGHSKVVRGARQQPGLRAGGAGVVGRGGTHRHACP